MNRQVLTALQLRGLKLLIAPTRQQKISTRSNFTADVFHISDFVTLGFLRPKTPLLLFVIQRIITVLRSQDVEVFTGNQVRLFTRSNTAGDHGEVLARLQGNAAPGINIGGDLADVVFLAGQFFAFRQRVFFVRRRADGEVFGRGHGDVAFGVDLAGDDGDVASGLNGQVAPGTGGGAQLGDVAAVVFAVREQAVGDFGRGDGDVASGLDGHVTTAFQHAAFVDDVAACRNAHVVGGFDARGTVGELVVALTEHTVVHRGDAAFVDHVAVDRGQ
ncbi:hypothetical protein ALQ15_200126 [Pseudomonas syringae pv. actinidiae]|uniref:Uncharacterized protein n=1 Tax=Pseudomonas syringae pv. actinidiae TaxID=103796 RepID=A0A7Z6UAH4_PSESF|nr:hypothetical protein ALQ15_200126 [Pseudomonas syringae pv. actinidiae]